MDFHCHQVSAGQDLEGRQIGQSGLWGSSPGRKDLFKRTCIHGVFCVSEKEIRSSLTTLRMNGWRRYSMLGCSIKDQTLMDVVPITWIGKSKKRNQIFWIPDICYSNLLLRSLLLVLVDHFHSDLVSVRAEQNVCKFFSSCEILYFLLRRTKPCSMTGSFV